MILLVVSDVPSVWFFSTLEMDSFDAYFWFKVSPFESR